MDIQKEIGWEGNVGQVLMEAIGLEMEAAWGPNMVLSVGCMDTSTYHKHIFHEYPSYQYFEEEILL